MTDADVRAVLEAAAEVNEWCHLAMRLAAETGARRSELAALRWDALVGDRLIVDRQVIVAKGDEGVTRKRVEATKTGSRRAVLVVGIDTRVGAIDGGGVGADHDVDVGPDAEPPHPDRIGWWWKRVREASRIDSKSSTADTFFSARSAVELFDALLLDRGYASSGYCPSVTGHAGSTGTPDLPGHMLVPTMRLSGTAMGPR